MGNIYKIVVLSLCFLFSYSSDAQVQTKNITLAKRHTIKPETRDTNYQARVDYLEAPSPGGDSYRGFLREQRKKVAERYPIMPRKSGQSGDPSLNPIIEEGFRMNRRLFNGTIVPFTGGIPNDNTLSVSNGGILMAAVNSAVYAHDLNGDSLMYPFGGLALSVIANSGRSLDNFFDPKLLYDPDYDRFILTFLANNTPALNYLIFAFSVSNNPLDGWHVYFLPGNPLDNNRWTDYPAFMVTKNELIYTANLIVPGVSWQVGFDGSMIWQIDKHAGFAGADSLPTKLWHGVEHNGRLVRNLHPVADKEGIAEEVYLLSNRNFDIENDTFFVVKLEGEINDTESKLDVKAVVSSTKYGLSPNGRQENYDPNDPTTGLDINDSRVLGAFLDREKIQFVHNCINPATGYAGVYHGFVRNAAGNPTITGNIIGHPDRDLGYPNIAWMGQQAGQAQAIIGFNHTSVTDYAGVSAIYFSNDSTYSEIVELIAGENYVNRINGPYDRWGDYFGIQRRYNEVNTVFTAGFFGLQTRASGTWISKLSSPDTSKITLDLFPKGSATLCKGIAEAKPQGGVPPYQYKWLEPRVVEGSNTLNNLCTGDSVFVEVTDARGHIATANWLYPQLDLGSKTIAYPNPFENQLAIQFTMPQEGVLRVFIYNLLGAQVAEVYQGTVQSGLNELILDVSPLRLGTYVIKGFRDGEEVFAEKVVRRR